MAVNVKIPTPLRRFAGEKSELAIEASDAADVAGALGRLLDAYPALKPQLLAESGAVRSFVNLFVNGEDVRFLDGPKTPVKDGDTLAIIPAIAGGAAR
jgi:molybdopterin converting factor small subunit